MSNRKIKSVEAGTLISIEAKKKIMVLAKEQKHFGIHVVFLFGPRTGQYLQMTLKFPIFIFIL